VGGKNTLLSYKILNAKQGTFSFQDTKRITAAKELLDVSIIVIF
jgi:hypothetical protein